MAAPASDASTSPGTTPTPFARLVRVEVRKAHDTRSGLWLLISTAALTAVVMVIQLAVGATPGTYVPHLQQLPDVDELLDRDPCCR